MGKCSVPNQDMFCLGNKMAADKTACKKSERTKFCKPWITFCACGWKAPIRSKPDPSKVTHCYIKPSSIDPAIICYSFPCQKINWLWLTLNSSQICTKLSEKFVYLKKTFDKLRSKFQIFTKTWNQARFFWFPIWCGGTSSSNYKASREHKERQTQKEKSLKQVIKEEKPIKKTNKNPKLSWNCKIINSIFILKCFCGIMPLTRYAFLDAFGWGKLGILRTNAKPVQRMIHK